MFCVSLQDIYIILFISFCVNNLSQKKIKIYCLLSYLKNWTSSKERASGEGTLKAFPSLLVLLVSGLLERLPFVSFGDYGGGLGSPPESEGYY